MSRGARDRIQYGEWYLDRRTDGTGSWYRCRYDANTGRVSRVSLRTEDAAEAERILAEFAAAQWRPQQAPIASVPLAWVLGHYLEHHALALPSADQARIAIRHWLDFWGEATVAQVTMERQVEFIAHLAGAGQSAGYVNRILNVGRAALLFSYRHGRIASAPFVTKAPSKAAAPKGRPLAMGEVAAMLDACREEHLWRFIILAITTMARPEAILDLHSDQVDLRGGFIDLNPSGREQTNKRRGIVPICDTLRPLLTTWGHGHYIVRHIRGVKPGSTARIERVRDIKVAWRAMRARIWPTDQPFPAGGDRAARRAWSLECAEKGREVQPYSFRHTLGRELRRRRVPGAEISLMLGHKLADESDTTSIYSPHDPDFCVHAKAALDAYCGDLSRMLARSSLASFSPDAAQRPSSEMGAV